MRWALALLMLAGGLLARAQTLGFSDENAAPWEPVTVEPANTVQGAAVERRVLAELADIDASLGRAHDQLATLDAAELALEERRTQHAAEVAAISEELATRRAEIKRRVQALYRVHRRGLATVIFGGYDGLDLRRRAAYLLWLVRAESGPLADVTARMRDRGRAAAALDEDTEALARNHEAATALQDRLVEQRAARVRLLAALRGEAAVKSAAKVELDQTRVALARELSPPTSPRAQTNFRDAFGRLPWPASGRMLRRFGAPADPGEGGLAESLGVDLAVPSGTMLRAVFDGTVSLAGNMPGYGLTIALNHGAYTTVYGHASKLSVRKGQPVNAGDVVAIAGNTGLAAENCCTLTFEVRYNGTPQDPLPWLARP